MSNNKLVMRRPVRAPKPRRFIGQEVFKTIVEMAYEMNRAQQAQDDWDHGEEVLHDMMENIKLKHHEWMMRKPACPNTVLVENPRRLHNHVTCVTFFSEPYRRPYRLPNGKLTYDIQRYDMLIGKRNDYIRTDRGLVLKQYAELRLSQDSRDGRNWIRIDKYDDERGWGNIHIYDEYTTNDGFTHTINRVTEYALRQHVYDRNLCFKS